MSKNFDVQIKNIKKLIEKLEETTNIDEAMKLHKTCKEELDKVEENIKEATQEIEEYTGLKI